MGKTTVVLDEELVRDAKIATGLKITRVLLETGLRELLRKRGRERLKAALGTFDLDLTARELKRKRAQS